MQKLNYIFFVQPTVWNPVMVELRLRNPPNILHLRNQNLELLGICSIDLLSSSVVYSTSVTATHGINNHLRNHRKNDGLIPADPALEMSQFKVYLQGELISDSFQYISWIQSRRELLMDDSAYLKAPWHTRLTVGWCQNHWWVSVVLVFDPRTRRLLRRLFGRLSS